MRSRPHRPDNLPKWIWLMAAPGLLPLIIITRYVDLQFYLAWIEGERGLIEVTTPILLLSVIIGGILIVRHHANLPAKWIAVWFALHALGSFYFAGEELSWGQHFFNWQTPEPIAALNGQGETNLHNMSSWFDQKPRLMVVLWSIFGGAGIPILVMFGKLPVGSPHDWRYWIFPRRECIIPGLMVALVRVPEDVLFSLGRAVPFPFDLRASEVQELYLAMFLSFYVISVLRRMRQIPVT